MAISASGRAGGHGLARLARPASHDALQPTTLAASSAATAAHVTLTPGTWATPAASDSTTAISMPVEVRAGRFAA